MKPDESKSEWCHSPGAGKKGDKDRKRQEDFLYQREWGKEYRDPTLPADCHWGHFTQRHLKSLVRIKDCLLEENPLEISNK